MQRTWISRRSPEQISIWSFRFQYFEKTWFHKDYMIFKFDLKMSGFITHETTKYYELLVHSL